MCSVVCALWSTRNTICDGRLPVRLSDILGPAPYAVETFSKEADSPSEERRANLLKYITFDASKTLMAEAVGATAFGERDFF